MLKLCILSVKLINIMNSQLKNVVATGGTCTPELSKLQYFLILFLIINHIRALVWLKFKGKTFDLEL